MYDSLLKKVNTAIERLRTFEPETEPYYLCYSGGKDSDTIRILAELAGVRADIVHNLTTVDAPETIHYIKSIPNVIIERAYYSDGTPKTMWNLIVKRHIPPLRHMRYCCSELKEFGGKGRLRVTGVRAAESINRKRNSGLVKIIGKPKTTLKIAEDMNLNYIISPSSSGGLILNYDNSDSRRFVEYCYRTTSTLVNPIIDWTDSEVWEFLNYYGCKANPLYQCGCKRIGCIGCPMQGQKGMQRDFEIYPTYKKAYIRTFGKLVDYYSDETISKPSSTWKTGEDIFNWWIGIDPNQLSFFD